MKPISWLRIREAQILDGIAIEQIFAAGRRVEQAHDRQQR
jgi:hypothetical protein